MDERQRFLDCLRTFVQIEGMTTLKQADSQLDISKNTITGRLSQFNEMLECEVTASGISRTTAGKSIEGEAKALLGELEANLDAARARLKRLATPQFPVQVAMSPTIWMWGAESELLPLTHSLSKRNAVEFLVANSERVERAVADEWFELGVTARHPTRKLHRKLMHKPFCSDEIVLAVPPEHEWATVDEVTADYLGEAPLIMLDTSANARLVVDHAMDAHGLDLIEPYEEVAMAVMAFEEAMTAKVPALVSKLAFQSPQGKMAMKLGMKQCRVGGVDFSREFFLVYGKRLREEAETVKDVLLEMID